MSFVRAIQNGKVIVEDGGDLNTALLRDLGGRRGLRHPNQWTIGAEDDSKLASVLASLRDAGLPMAGGQGRPPSAQFDRFRELGLIAGSHWEVVWRGPGDKLIRTKE